MQNKKFFIVIIIFFLFFLLLPSQNINAQAIPPFKMQLTNGNAYTYKDVPKTKPLLIIYFAPDCGHCQALIREIIKKVNDFKKVEILLVSFEPLNMVTKFQKDYHLLQYSNIKCGTEAPTFYFKNLFNLDKTPFTALYNKKGKLIISYKDVPQIDGLVKRLHSL
jgi:thioredoxin-related protein